MDNEELAKKIVVLLESYQTISEDDIPEITALLDSSLVGDMSGAAHRAAYRIQGHNTNHVNCIADIILEEFSRTVALKPTVQMVNGQPCSIAESPTQEKPE